MWKMGRAEEERVGAVEGMRRVIRGGGEQGEDTAL